MGLSSWFRDLGVPWKISVGILGGVAAVTSAYGLYTFYAHLQDRKDESFNGETAGETSDKKILVLGLEGAGKSTFLAALAQHDSPITSEREATKPTEGFHVVCVSTEGISLNIWEIGGKFQSYWPNFLTDVSVIVYAIDSSASERFDESKNALLGVLSEDTLKGVPLLLLACKQDAEGAKLSEDIASFFGLQELCSTHKVQIAAIEILGNGEARGVQEAKELILNFCAQK